LNEVVVSQFFGNGVEHLRMAIFLFIDLISELHVVLVVLKHAILVSSEAMFMLYLNLGVFLWLILIIVVIFFDFLLLF
jgi:hypothetical protein